MQKVPLWARTGTGSRVWFGALFLVSMILSLHALGDSSESDPQEKSQPVLVKEIRSGLSGLDYGLKDRCEIRLDSVDHFRAIHKAHWKTTRRIELSSITNLIEKVKEANRSEISGAQNVPDVRYLYRDGAKMVVFFQQGIDFVSTMGKEAALLRRLTDEICGSQ